MIATREEIPAALPVGTPGHSPIDGGTNISSLTSANSVDHVTARLKRDDPALAEDVVAGRLTANAAARQKGWRKPRVAAQADRLPMRRAS